MVLHVFFADYFINIFFKKKIFFHLFIYCKLTVIKGYTVYVIFYLVNARVTG